MTRCQQAPSSFCSMTIHLEDVCSREVLVGHSSIKEEEEGQAAARHGHCQACCTQGQGKCKPELCSHTSVARSSGVACCLYKAAAGHTALALEHLHCMLTMASSSLPPLEPGLASDPKQLCPIEDKNSYIGCITMRADAMRLSTRDF